MQNSKSTYGLVGYPVHHSLSPRMHNSAFQHLKVEAEYTLFPLAEHDLDHFFDDLRKEDCSIFGLNVTVPYKERVLRYIDNMTPFAQKVQAINTIVVDESRELTAYNTDGPGFLTHLTELGFNTLNKNISILGAGGAARALVTVLCLITERPEGIRLYDIDKGKADYLISDLGTRLDVSLIKTVHSIDDLELENTDLLINATPIGMKPDDPLLLERHVFRQDMFVYDLIYNPAQTPLLKMAREAGAQTANGLGMLFYQGVLAFQHWANIELDYETKQIMRHALEEGLKNL